ncbi:MAG: quinolinate synthase NadA [bacterium]
MDVNTSESSKTLDQIWHQVSKYVTEPEWALYMPLIEEINTLKRELNVTILAHNYQPVEIYHGVADFCGDSLQLAQFAAQKRLPRVIMAGVYFMAETVKIISPDTEVLIPSLDAGCSLAESITANDVRVLRDRFPNAQVVSYVNTSAAVKAESDFCCTSSNAVDVVNACTSDEVIFLPDSHLGTFVQAHTHKRLHLWRGQCDVHAVFDVDSLNALRWTHPDIHILVHPECQQSVQKAADFVGSTSALANYIEANTPRRAALITECTMSANVAALSPTTEFIQPCSLCPHMRRISLRKILHSLKNSEHIVEVTDDIAVAAQRAINAMLSV